MLGIKYSDIYVTADDFKTPQDYLNYLYGRSKGFVARANIHKGEFRESLFSTKYLNKNRYHGESEVYTSMNAFLNKKVGRRTTNLRELNTLFIDIDCYNKGYTQDEVISLLESDYFDIIIPTPTFVINSGRGIYLIYKVIRGEKSKEQESRLALPRWTSIQKFLYKQLEPLGADPKALDAARVLRVPFSYNTKSESMVCIERFYNLAYTLDSIKKEYDIPYDSTKHKQEWGRATSKQITVAKWQAKNFGVALPDFCNYSDTFNFISKYATQTLSQKNIDKKNTVKKTYSTRGRINDLFTLFGKLRTGENCSREYALFLCRLWMIESTGDYDTAVKTTLALNDRLDCPFQRSYVLSRTKSAETCYKKGNPYRYSTNKVIEVLNITAEEQQQLCYLRNGGLYNNAKTKKERNRKTYLKKLEECGKTTKRQKIEERHKQLSYLLSMGRSKEEICKELGISSRTYCRDLTAIKEKAIKDKAKRKAEEGTESSTLSEADIAKNRNEKEAYKVRLTSCTPYYEADNIADNRCAKNSASLLYRYSVPSPPLWKTLGVTDTADDFSTSFPLCSPDTIPDTS